MAEVHGGPRQTTREFHARLTEGEVDLLIALTSLVAPHYDGQGQSPLKYAERLRKQFIRAAGYDEGSSDAYKLSYGQILFSPYSELDKPVPAIMDEASAAAFAQAMNEMLFPVEPKRGIRRFFSRRSQEPLGLE